MLVPYSLSDARISLSAKPIILNHPMTEPPVLKNAFWGIFCHFWDFWYHPVLNNSVDQPKGTLGSIGAKIDIDTSFSGGYKKNTPPVGIEPGWPRFRPNPLTTKLRDIFGHFTLYMGIWTHFYIK